MNLPVQLIYANKLFFKKVVYMLVEIAKQSETWEFVLCKGVFVS
jgi:hypothetical protein